MASGVGIALVIIAVLGIVVYFETDSRTVFQCASKVLLLLGCLTFCVQCFGVRLMNLFSRIYLRNHVEGTPNLGNENHYKERERNSRQQIQEDHTAKASSYKQRILDPREEIKRKNKEEEHYRFLGPSWKGKGQALGGEDLTVDRTSRDAAEARRLPDNINEEVAARGRKEKERLRRKNKVMVLPEEPIEGSVGSISVVLRTPIGQICQRRFHNSSTIENVLDFMTSLGFHKKHYTLATSFPRQCLTDQRSTSLSELGYSSKIILNVEEIDS